MMLKRDFIFLVSSDWGVNDIYRIEESLTPLMKNEMDNTIYKAWEMTKKKHPELDLKDEMFFKMAFKMGFLVGHMEISR